MPLGDEREHTLREVAALGNIKATLHLAHSGVNINSQNAMNGWSALHWAAHRGHEHVVTALLRSGADPFLKTNKGQTALDLAVKYEPVTKILKLAMGDQAKVSVGPEPALPIVPTYIKNPDLEKTWLMPDEFSENKIENVVRREKAAEALANDSTTKQSTTSAPQHSRIDVHNTVNEKEVLVYLNERSDDNLIGSVFLRNESMDAVIKQIKDELDALPEAFSVSRNNGKVTIPISPKQMSKRLLDIFRGEDDVLVLIPS
ncbi:hypothetical protein BDF20DRAFT_852200 [Mycotypha africana]|uniref:uncharacterized protein n=1 Tax=Mycotypha africana TaxID=64632 RepID=UPI0023009741|nr:uncharacterized protein BDF20DRAFT_852200 [Mycotypha africana]KAI8987789.1 hypothetical protein BDF20DRAFT_852200 [Mycotypha africana]